MNDTITVCGIVATEPRHLVTETGIAITSMRLASPSRRWDRANSTWTNGPTNWFTVTAFRSLAANVHKSLKKGDRIIVTGRVRIRTWERDGRGGTSIEIDAEGLGHDLAWGISNWIRVPRHTSEASAAPGSGPRVNPSTGEVEGSDSDPDDMAGGAMAGGAMADDDMAGDVPGGDVPGGDARADGEPHHDELPEAAAAAAATAALHRDDAHAGSVPPADLHAA